MVDRGVAIGPFDFYRTLGTGCGKGPRDVEKIDPPAPLASRIARSVDTAASRQGQGKPAPKSTGRGIFSMHLYQ